MPNKKRASTKQSFPVPLLIALVGGILLIATAILVAANNKPAPATPTVMLNNQAETVLPTVISDQGPYPEVARVTVEDAKAAWDAGNALFVDVRGDDVYALSHIAGAVSIPLGDLEARLSELDPTKWIITYCT